MKTLGLIIIGYAATFVVGIAVLVVIDRTIEVFERRANAKKAIEA